jgi:hypothetical protein
VGPALIVVGTVALDWGIAWLVWRGAVRILGLEPSPRLSAVMPWLLFQLFILAGLVVTGALARATGSAIVLTAIPLALFAALLAVPLALFRARGGNKIDLRICLDHTYATALVWLVVFVLGVVL